MSDMTTAEAIISYLLSHESLSGQSDIRDIAPNLTYAQAYEAQFAAKARQAGKNGPIIGYQALLTSEGAKALAPAGMPTPCVGTMQLRNWWHPSVPFPPTKATYVVECEVGMRMAKDLRGRAVTPAMAREAVASVHAALEIVSMGDEWRTWSGQHITAVINAGSSIIFAPDGEAADLDLKDEPIHLRVDGEEVAQAVGGDSGGDPFAVLADIANILGAHGRGLEAGMVVMTGSATRPQPLPTDVRYVEASFGRLGTVGATFESASVA